MRAGSQTPVPCRDIVLSYSKGAAGQRPAVSLSREDDMNRTAFGAFTLVAALGIAVNVADAQPVDLSKYPAWEGKWGRDPGPPRYDPSKPGRRGQQPPLTPEHQKVFEASLADQEAGGQGNDTTHRCIPVGMPRQATSG